MGKGSISFHIWKGVLFPSIYGKGFYFLPYMERGSISFHIWKGVLFPSIYGKGFYFLPYMERGSIFFPAVYNRPVHVFWSGQVGTPEWSGAPPSTWIRGDGTWALISPAREIPTGKEINIYLYIHKPFLPPLPSFSSHPFRSPPNLVQGCCDDPDHCSDFTHEDFAFSQLAECNWQVVNCTTPANIFHVLRRQIALPFRKPVSLNLWASCILILRLKLKYFRGLYRYNVNIYVYVQ